MKVQKLPPALGLLFIVALAVIYYLDPVRNYPTQTLSTMLEPGEEIYINRPAQLILPLGIESYIYPEMHMWFISHRENITVVDYALHARADVLYQLRDTREYYLVRNDGAARKRFELKTIYAPSPENQDSYRNYIYIMTGFAEVLTLLAYTLLNGAVSLDKPRKGKKNVDWFVRFLSRRMRSRAKPATV